jgi:diaminobutyrate-2-oxoglutarate transaminase
MESLKTFETLESEVRGYIRSFPTVFTTAKGAELTDESGRTYLDFFAGAGALNYGHNNPLLKQKLLDYLMSDGVTHSLDMGTVAKRAFLERFREVILEPRDMDYKVQFPGPTGTNAVEAALKLARKVTGRTNVVAFTNGFHGMTLGSLATTGNSFKRAGAGVPLANARTMPFCDYVGGADSLRFFEMFLEDSSSGLDKPAAVILETVQAEGGVNVASAEWLRGVQRLCREHGMLFIIDDIQVGCGRTGGYFSFEDYGLDPDIICLSKSLSGYGLPMAIVLIKPEHDIWEPGEHNGTFRGHNPAFVTATAALDYWANDQLATDVARKAQIARRRLEVLARRYGVGPVRGRGLIQGIECEPGVAGKVAAACFERGLIIETAGARDEVLKLLPPLTISEAQLEAGLDIIEDAFNQVVGRKSKANGRATSDAGVGIHA